MPFGEFADPGLFSRYADACEGPVGRQPLQFHARHTLAFYPNAITLSPDVTAAETEAGRHQPYAVKDSFARLDLAGEGLEPIFDADWIARLPAPPEPSEDYLCWDSVTGPGELAQWEAAWAGADTAVAPRSRPG